LPSNQLGPSGRKCGSLIQSKLGAENPRLRKQEGVAALAGLTPTPCDRGAVSWSRESSFQPKVSVLLGIDIGLNSLLDFRLEV